MKAEAEKILNTSLDYWFRQKFNLSPKDPRYLDCEPWEIELELELDHLMKSKLESYRRQRNILCPTCHTKLHGNVCPNCGEEVSHVTETFVDPSSH